ncbi:MAG: Ldh family oxidoreductase [Planctomycetota bacterium]|nr:Ldh family oxidoreductase [Planctomycetota bacterium]
MPTIPADQLQDFATALLAAGGATDEESRRVGPSLVDANLKGYESHGVMRIPYYLEATKSGECESGAELTILKESSTHITADANWGFGQVQAGRLLERLSEKAHANGMAIGTMIHCGHIGRLGEYCERAAGEGLVSMMMVNSHGAAARVAPPGGKAPRLSTNPLAIGVPNGDEPLILDFSTSATAEGKVRVKKIAGEKCPEGWLLDSAGRPTTDPNDLYADPPGSILPMGGAQAYKGFGLSLMIEILTGALSGGVVARQPFYPKKGNCVFVMLLDPAAFGGTEHFQTEVAQLADYIRSCPRIDGCERIILPGDPERFVLADRSVKGILLDDENWAVLCRLAKDLDVAIPNV